MSTTWPRLPLEEWRDSKITFHLFCQIVGKVRLACHPPLNHWWHVPLYVTPRGLTTSLLPHPDAPGRVFEMELDLVDHTWNVRVSDGRNREFPLRGHSVASFYREVMDTLEELGLGVDILAEPFDPSKTESSIAFAEDREHQTYDAEAVHRFHRILALIDPIFKEFRGRFLGKVSPVHFFWHSLDLAVTRFSGKAAPLGDDADPVSREAYSHEVISAGFWAGDPNVPEPAFYAYAYPEPDGLGDRPLRPAAARWEPQDGGGFMALLPYHAVIEAEDPKAEILEFLQSSYEAAAELAGWDREGLERSDR